MNFLEKARNVSRVLIQRYAPKEAKRRLWNCEFRSGRWNCLDNSDDELLHLQIEKYANNGSVLDLGCGPGKTGIELNPCAYRSYTGVDISDVAIAKASKRAEEAGRKDRNEYCQSDILTYVPQRQYDVILYGDSIYYVPLARTPEMLSRYAQYLKETGVFIARICDASGKRANIVRAIEDNFELVEKQRCADAGFVITFRPSGGRTSTRKQNVA